MLRDAIIDKAAKADYEMTHSSDGVIVRWDDPEIDDTVRETWVAGVEHIIEAVEDDLRAEGAVQAMLRVTEWLEKVGEGSENEELYNSISHSILLFVAEEFMEDE